jgi:hypothetical protein
MSAKKSNKALRVEEPTLGSLVATAMCPPPCDEQQHAVVPPSNSITSPNSQSDHPQRAIWNIKSVTLSVMWESHDYIRAGAFGIKAIKAGPDCEWLIIDRDDGSTSILPISNVRKAELA